MPTLQAASLTPAEREALDCFVGLLRSELGPELIAVWLYGSRARGERHEDSDVDLLVITACGRSDRPRVMDLLQEACGEDIRTWFTLSPLVQSPEWVEGRRAIDSFYIQEVDRDKIVLHGEP